MSATIVRTKDLTRSFAPDAGLFDLDLEIPRGQIIGIIGPSGSGKTTTVRLMTGLLAPDSGSVEVLGENPTDFDSEMRARLGYMPQHAILYPDLTLRQNLQFAASLYGMTGSSRGRQDDLIDFLGLSSAMGRLPEQASGGEQRRLMLAATLVHDPELLFLDEPTAGIDPVLRRKIWEHLEEVSEQGASLIVTTQYVGEAAYCDYVAVLAEGRMLTFDTPEGLRRTAFGGELLDVVFASRTDVAKVKDLERDLDASILEWTDDRIARFVVDDAGTAGPRVHSWAESTEVDIAETEPHVPPFDDVFVELIERLTSDETDADAPTEAQELS